MNPHRGEISAELDGRSYTLRLTLGALAELEAALGEGDLAALVARFETGRFQARDLAAIIGAGLRGAGHAVSDEEVATMATPDGVTGYVAIVSDLLTATFPPSRDRGDTKKNS
jgi:hypothetical protein